MPELPEVETVVRALRPQLVGRRIGGVRRGRKPLRRPWQPAWAGLYSGAIHPTAEAHAIVADHMVKHVRQLVDKRDVVENAPR